MVLVSGFNVYPNEVERTVAPTPAVRWSALVGVPDDRTEAGSARHREEAIRC